MKSLLLTAACLAAGLTLTTRADTPAAPPASPFPAKVEGVVRADTPGPVINRNIYGQFAEHLGHCIYEGIWVGEDSPIPNTRGIRNDVAAALKKLEVPVLRWPGGCFADEYHWKDGIGPRNQRPKVYNSHWGGVVENNHFGTHEFLDLCEQIGAEPYIGVNLGSGTVQEMMQWIEYLTSDGPTPMADLRRANGRDKPWKVKYFGIGNESWGCGGSMRVEYYSDVYRQFQEFAKNYGDNRIVKIACGANGDNPEWTEVMMKNAARQMHGLSLHYYTLPTGSWQGSKGSATQFNESDYITTLNRTIFLDDIIARHSAIMDKYDPKKKVGLVVDEWGTWYDVEPGTNPGFLYMQNTMRDAVVAALNLHIFHRHAGRVSMANIAQMINVLQSMIHTDKEKMLLTPTYHVFEMFKVHQGATALPVEQPGVAQGKYDPLLVSASRNKDGVIHVSAVNPDLKHPLTLRLRLAGAQAQAVTGRILTADTIQAMNTFAKPDAVQPAAFTGAALKGDQLEITLPTKSVVVLELK